MALIHAMNGKYNESLIYFEKAEPQFIDDVNFISDYARTLGHAGVASRSEELVVKAFKRFEQVFEHSPQHMMNLQNWAIILFYVGEYAEAWKKMTLAEATPEGKNIDRQFLSALESKMPRPR
ncbi:MAG: hypothetical protein ABII81_12375 [Pseudomonadota bacterium]